MMLENNLSEISLEIRKHIIRMLAKAGMGHTAGPLGTADLFTALYFGGLIRTDPKRPNWEDRDRVVLSCGHYAPVMYATLAMAGYFSVEELMTLRKLGSRLQGHVVHQVPFASMSYKQLPGIENTGGPLGQGVSLSVGMALAAKLDNKKWKTICISSDGEQQEGQVWEAYMTAVKYELGNLIFFVDRNDIQISGKVNQVMPIEPLELKYKSFGLAVKEINGHDFEEIKSVMKWSEMYPKQPKMVIVKTTPGKGVSFMENKFEWHGKAPTQEEAELALIDLDKNYKNE